jgi:hypothetical protein
MFDVTDLNLRYRERAELTARINVTGYQERPKSRPIRRLRVTLAALLVRLGQRITPAAEISVGPTVAGRARL